MVSALTHRLGRGVLALGLHNTYEHALPTIVSASATPFVQANNVTAVPKTG